MKNTLKILFKKFLDSSLPYIIAIFALMYTAGFIVEFHNKVITVTTFLIYFKGLFLFFGGLLGVILGFFIIGLVLCLVFALPIIVYSDNATEKKVRKEFLEKFSLIPNTYTEVSPIFEDSEDKRELFLGLIHLLNDTENFVPSVSFNNVSILLTENNSNIKMLLDIIYASNGKFYLYLDEEYKLYWVLKNSDDKDICVKEVSYTERNLEKFEKIS